MSPAPHPPGALDGVRVLDLSRILAGPWAAQLLGDLGAAVIKVERPGAGDDTRGWGPPFLSGGDAAYYACANRNKEVVAIDFATPQGAALVRDLADAADILVENFRPGALARYGLDYASLSQRNPRLIYCSITGFGQTGPYCMRGGYDFLVQGMAGMMSLTGRPDDAPGGGPLKAGAPVADLFTGMYAATSMLAALHHQRATGQGQHIDASLLQSQIAVLANHWSSYLNAGAAPRRMGNAHPTVVPYRDFAAADGPLIVAIGSDAQFARFCRLLGLPHLAEDARFAKNAGRQMARAELEALLAAEIRKWKRADLLAAMEAQDVPGGPINDLDAVFGDPQVLARETVTELHAMSGEAVRVVGYPHRLSETPATARRAPARLGEDTFAVLQRELGLAGETLAALARQGVIAGLGQEPRP